MSSSPFQPYAPPGAPLGPPGYLETALPPGVRRFRLDPARHRSRATRRLLRLGATLAVVFGGMFVLEGGPANGSTLVTMIPILLIAVASIVLVGVLRLRGMMSSELLTYEVLLGARVLRRSIARTLPAEILRPEVTAMFETGDGLWVCCDAPRRALFVVSAVDGYDDIRRELATWRPIEPLSGWAAYRRATGWTSHQAPRDAIAGTALASDPSLATELEHVRSASSAAWRNYPAGPPLRRFAYGAIALWVLLIVMFLAIWQVLTPSERPRQPSDRAPPTTRP
jgi:hypothetical protein